MVYRDYGEHVASKQRQIEELQEELKEEQAKVQRGLEQQDAAAVNCGWLRIRSIEREIRDAEDDYEEAFDDMGKGEAMNRSQFDF